jgi:DNA repair protein RecO (recombination protein O)
MRHRTEGIVLKSFSLGEADLIVTYLTPDMGLKKAFAKSPRKVLSRFGSSLEPFTHARITLMGREDAELPRLTQSDIIRTHQGLREDLKVFSMATGMAELALALMQENTPGQDVFDLLLLMLGRFEVMPVRLTALVYSVRLMALKGYAPRLSSCGRCGSVSQKFFVAQGSVLCERCALALGKAEAGIISLSAGSIKLYEALSTWDIDKTSRIKPSEGLMAELGGVLDAHLEFIFSKPLKSRRFDAVCR